MLAGCREVSQQKSWAGEDFPAHTVPFWLYPQEMGSCWDSIPRFGEDDETSFLPWKTAAEPHLRVRPFQGGRAQAP